MQRDAASRSDVSAVRRFGQLPSRLSILGQAPSGPLILGLQRKIDRLRCVDSGGVVERQIGVSRID